MSGIGIRLGSIAEVDVWGGTAIERERETISPPTYGCKYNIMY